MRGPVCIAERIKEAWIRTDGRMTDGRTTDGRLDGSRQLARTNLPSPRAGAGGKQIEDTGGRGGNAGPRGASAAGRPGAAPGRALIPRPRPAAVPAVSRRPPATDA